MDYPTNNQPSYFGFFGETTRRSHLDQPVSTIATSSKRFAVEKKGARVMHTAMAHLRSCRWFKLKPISRTRVAYFCQGEYIRRIIVARNQIEVARHEKWIMNSTLRTPHTYTTCHACQAHGVVFWSWATQKKTIFSMSEHRVVYFRVRFQDPKSKWLWNFKLKKRSTWLLCDAKTCLQAETRYLKVKVSCCGPAKHFFRVSNSFNLNYSSSCDLLVVLFHSEAVCTEVKMIVRNT